MEYLLSDCPRCGNRTWFRTKDQKKVMVGCSNCGMVYSDIVEGDRVREIDFHWQLRRNVYPIFNYDLGVRFHVIIAGVLLLMILPFIVLPAFYLLSGGISGGLNQDFLSFLIGSILALFIFFLIAALGCFHSFKQNSFAIALTGSIFSFLGLMLSVILMGLPYFSDTIIQEVIWIYFAPFLFSLVSIILLVKNRKIFDYGD